MSRWRFTRGHSGSKGDVDPDRQVRRMVRRICSGRVGNDGGVILEWSCCKVKGVSLQNRLANGGRLYQLILPPDDTASYAGSDVPILLSTAQV